jgi:hypothetical protein
VLRASKLFSEAESCKKRTWETDYLYLRKSLPQKRDQRTDGIRNERGRPIRPMARSTLPKTGEAQMHEKKIAIKTV